MSVFFTGIVHKFSIKYQNGVVVHNDDVKCFHPVFNRSVITFSRNIKGFMVQTGDPSGILFCISPSLVLNCNLYKF